MEGFIALHLLSDCTRLCGCGVRSNTIYLLDTHTDTRTLRTLGAVHHQPSAITLMHMDIFAFVQTQKYGPP